MKRRIRVLQVITSLAGGAGLNAYHLTRYLDRSRFDVDLAFGPGYPLDHQVAADGLTHHVLRWSRKANPFATLLGTQDVVRLLRRERYDIVHAHCSLAGLAGRLAARWCGVPKIVFTVHAFASRPHQAAWKQRLALEIERRLDPYTDHYCVSTQIFHDQLLQKKIAETRRVSIIPLGIELASVALSREQARARLGLPNDAAVVISAGRLESQKGLRYLIEAWSAVRRDVPGAMLVLLGDGPLRGELESLAERLNVRESIYFTGWRTDANELLAAGDLFCLPSLWEAFGYVLLEAMAAGIPIVASDVDGIPEVLMQGRLGKLVPAGDCSSLARAVADLLHDPAERHRLKQTGLQHVHSRYALAGMVEGYATLYERLHNDK